MASQAGPHCGLTWAQVFVVPQDRKEDAERFLLFVEISPIAPNRSSFYIFAPTRDRIF
jgi:hypothetical protein